MGKREEGSGVAVRSGLSPTRKAPCSLRPGEGAGLPIPPVRERLSLSGERPAQSHSSRCLVAALLILTGEVRLWVTATGPFGCSVCTLLCRNTFREGGPCSGAGAAPSSAHVPRPGQRAAQPEGLRRGARVQTYQLARRVMGGTVLMLPAYTVVL